MLLLLMGARLYPFPEEAAGVVLVAGAAVVLLLLETGTEVEEETGTGAMLYPPAVPVEAASVVLEDAGADQVW